MRSVPGRSRGFTLIELLVVIAIVIIIATASLVVLAPKGRETALKEAARVTKGAFTQARQLSSSRRQTTFLVFANALDAASGLSTGRIEFHRDANGDGSYQAASDPIDGQPILLTKGIVFRLRPPFANPTAAAPAWIALLADGSIPTAGAFASGDVSSSAFDAAFSSGAMGNSWDIAIEPSNGAPGRVHLDVALPTGLVRKVAFFE